MATIRRKQVYEEILVRDQWEITKACCDKLTSIQADWKNCPYCGEKITESDAVVDTLPNAGKMGG